MPRPRVARCDDTADGVCDADCSLREALAAAKPLGVGSDTIVIPPGVYTLSLGSELVIDKNLTLIGAGAEDTIIQAATEPGVSNFRVFNITAGNVWSRFVTMTSDVNDMSSKYSMESFEVDLFFLFAFFFGHGELSGWEGGFGQSGGNRFGNRGTDRRTGSTGTRTISYYRCLGTHGAQARWVQG